MAADLRILHSQPRETRTWGEAERLRLHAAREHAGHSMERCAAILRSEFGVAAASQSNGASSPWCPSVHQLKLVSYDTVHAPSQAVKGGLPPVDGVEGYGPAVRLRLGEFPWFVVRNAVAG